MILIVTNKGDYTADFLILELNDREIDFVRFNTEDFPVRSSVNLEINTDKITGHIICDGRKVELSDITSVWYRRPVSSIPHVDITDEEDRKFVISECHDTLAGLWKLIDCFWVSHPECLARAESKILQLREANQIGFHVPKTLITSEPSCISGFYEQNQRAIIYKPLRHSRFTREGKFSLLYTNLVTVEQAAEFDLVKHSPSLFQPYISKKLELRVTVVGESVFAAEIHSQSVNDAKIDWRKVDSRYIKHIPHQLPLDLESKCVSLVKKMGLSFGAIDLILTPEGDYVFLEINPNGQWAWIQQLCPVLDIRGELINLLLDPPVSNRACN